MLGLIIGVLLITFIVIPILYVLARSLGLGEAGFTLANYQTFFDRPYYFNALTNSLTLSISVTAIVTTLCFMYAYLVTRIKNRILSTVLRAIALVPLLAPPFIFSISLITLGGRRGVVSQLLGMFFDIEFSIYGWSGVILAQIIGLFPLGFMMLENVLRSMDLNLEETSMDMGANQWRTLWSVTIPLVMPGIFKAILLVFMKSISDFATPMVIGGGLSFLATDAYLLVVGQHNMEMAAVLATFLILPTMIIFFIQNYILTDKKTRTTISGQSAGTAQIRMARSMKVAFSIPTALSAFLITTAFAVVFWSAFVVIPGVDNSFTLENFQTATGWDAMFTSLQVAVISATVVAFMGVIQAYLNVREKIPGRFLKEYIALFGMGVPGTVVGIGYILAFNQAPLNLTGTLLIIIISMVFRHLGVGVEGGISKLHQIGTNMEEASQDMGASKLVTFFRVVLPMMGSSFLYGFIYTFMCAMTSIAAAVFLVFPGTTLGAVYILHVAEQGDVSRAAAMSVVLIAIVAISLGILSKITSRTHLSRL